MSDNTDNTVTETPNPKPTKAKKAPVLYPFPTKAQVLLSQEMDDVVLEHLGILVSRQTEDEHEERVTRYRNRRGLMSSHAVVGTKLHDKVASGESLTPEEWSQARKIVSRYGKQLAAHYREVMLESNPELRAVAEIFSAG